MISVIRLRAFILYVFKNSVIRIRFNIISVIRLRAFILYVFKNSVIRIRCNIISVIRLRPFILYVVKNSAIRIKKIIFLLLIIYKKGVSSNSQIRLKNQISVNPNIIYLSIAFSIISTE